MITNDQLDDPYQTLADAIEQLVAVAINNGENADPRVIIDRSRSISVDLTDAHDEVESWLADVNFAVDAYETVATHMIIDATDDELAAALAEVDQPVG